LLFLPCPLGVARRARATRSGRGHRSARPCRGHRWTRVSRREGRTRKATFFKKKYTYIISRLFLRRFSGQYMSLYLGNQRTISSNIKILTDQSGRFLPFRILRKDHFVVVSLFPIMCLKSYLVGVYQESATKMN